MKTELRYDLSTVGYRDGHRFYIAAACLCVLMLFGLLLVAALVLAGVPGSFLR